MGDPYRWCIYCGADCYLEEPPHHESCPMSTGLFPVREEDLTPHGMRCIDCNQVFQIGDVYVQRPTENDAVVECVCIGCGLTSMVS